MASDRSDVIDWLDEHVGEDFVVQVWFGGAGDLGGPAFAAGPPSGRVPLSPMSGCVRRCLMHQASTVASVVC